MNRVTHINSYFGNPSEFIKCSDFLRIMDMILENFFKKNKNFDKDYIAWLLNDIWERNYSVWEQRDLSRFIRNPWVQVLWSEYTKNSKLFVDFSEKDIYEVLACLKHKNLLFDRETNGDEEKWYSRICSAIEGIVWNVDAVL